MGAGITQSAAEAGKKVTLVEIDEQRGEQRLQTIKKQLNKKVTKERITQAEADEVFGKVNLEVDLDSIRNVQLVIEAVPEIMDVKKNVFKEIDDKAPKDALMASNTSGLSIASIGAATQRPEQVIGFHYFYPVPIMKLVEVTPSIMTSSKTVKDMMQFALEIGKQPVKCNDYPGFLVNRLLIPMVNEAIFCVMEGAKPEDVDEAMKLGANHRMGPITLADFVGLDVLLATMEGLCEGFSDSKYRPCPLLKKMVEAGNYGVKSGRGFYQYDKNGQKVEPVHN
ncbi:3-hydroxyacyl-CoA dehydrogenase [Natribacillus halophilus]|uniref:3-hydroxyacyl-CoA dehydrogenase n=2 Tax=Natribacillus halophilus TaxID=549003 RepID=A0A1G8MK27_9BACI|nr:3-hydroxyacyl-CoA dehydrogenase [Natribacillus halophilus]